MNWSSFDFDKMFRLEGRTAIVTGGGGILGEGFAFGLAARGANVVVADVNLKAASDVASRLSDKGYVGVLATETDVSSEASVDLMVAKAVSRFGSIDILVNNAAAPVDEPKEFFAPFESFTLAEWRRQMSVSLDGMFLVARTVCSRMISQGRGGSIVQISSIYGVVSSDERIYEGAEYRGYAINNPVSYSAAKSGVIGLTRWMSTNLAKHKIRVNAIAPGGVFSGENGEFTRRYGARVPMGRMADQHEIVGGVLYLASDAATYVTGQCFVIDGGLSAW